MRIPHAIWLRVPAFLREEMAAIFLVEDTVERSGQAPNKKPPEGGFLCRQQRSGYAPATSMPLNSPVAIFSFQTAGPVMWALVPPASTATVTGMSTTSNS